MSKFSILCLNGGGVKGVLQVGALSEFAKDAGITELYTVFTDGIYGISIGAIIGTLIAFKFTINEIIELSHTLHLDELIEPPRLDHILNIQMRMGLDTGLRVYEFLKNIFQKKGLNIDNLKIGDASAPLYIIASDITKTKTIIFNETVNVWDAIRASISLPLVFTPHILKNRVFMDGAVLCKNIVKMVPKSQRKNALALLCVNMNVDNSTTTKLMSHVIHAPSISETRWSHLKYPKNVCLLTETSTGMLDFNPDIAKMLDFGASVYRLFSSESGS